MENSNSETVQGLFMQIMRLHFIRSHSLLEKVGVYPGQPPVLFCLYKNNGQSQRELAKSINVKPATITVMIKRLEKSGLVERKQDKKDQRVSRIFLTESGEKVCEKLKVIHAEIERECFEGFSEEEKIVIRRLFMQIRDNLKSVCKDEKDFCYHGKKE